VIRLSLNLHIFVPVFLNIIFSVDSQCKLKIIVIAKEKFRKKKEIIINSKPIQQVNVQDYKIFKLFILIFVDT